MLISKNIDFQTQKTEIYLSLLITVINCQKFQLGLGLHAYFRSPWRDFVWNELA